MTTINVTTTTPGTVKVSPSNIPDVIEPYIFSFQGPLAAYTGMGKLYLEFPATIESVRFTVGDTSPATTTFDVQKNLSASIFDSAVVLGANTSTLFRNTGFQNVPLARGDFLTVNINSASLTLPAANLTVTIRVRRLS